MEIEIRKATIDDLEDIRKLNHELCKKEVKEFDSTIDADWPLGKAGEDYFKERIEKKNGCVFVAVDGGKVVGYLAGGIVEREDYRKNIKIAEAENMFVIESYRGDKLGARLFESFVEWCKECNIKRIKTVASAGNSRAIDFYRREGFEDYDLVLEKEL